MDLTVADLLKKFLNPYFQTYPAGYKGIQLFKQGIKDVLENKFVTLQKNEKSVLDKLLSRSTQIFTSDLDYVKDGALAIPPNLAEFVKSENLKPYATGFKNQDEIKKGKLQDEIADFTEMYAQGLPKHIISQNKFFKWNVLASCFLYSNIQDLTGLGYTKAGAKLSQLLYSHIKVSKIIIKYINLYTIGTWKAPEISVFLKAADLKFPKPDVLQDRHSVLLQLNGYDGENLSISPDGGLKNETQITINASNSYNNQQNSIQYNQSQYGNNNQIQQNVNQNAAQSPYTQSNQQAGFWPSQNGRQVVSLQQAQQYASPDIQAIDTTGTAYNYQTAQHNTHFNTSAGYSNTQTSNQQLAITYDSTNTANQFSNQNTQDASVSVPDGFSTSDIPYLNRAVGIAADTYAQLRLDEIREDFRTNGGGMNIKKDFARYVFRLSGPGRTNLAAALSTPFAGTSLQNRVQDIIDALPQYIRDLPKQQLFSCFSQKLRQKINSQDATAAPQLTHLPDGVVDFYNQYPTIPNNMLPALLHQCLEFTTAREVRRHLKDTDASWYRKIFLSFLNSAALGEKNRFYTKIIGQTPNDQSATDQFWQFVLQCANSMPDQWYLACARHSEASENRVHMKKNKKSSQQPQNDYQMNQSFGEFNTENTQNINITAATSGTSSNYANQQTYGGFNGQAAVPLYNGNQIQQAQFNLPPNSTTVSNNNLTQSQYQNTGGFDTTYWTEGAPAANTASTLDQPYPNTVKNTASGPRQMPVKQNFNTATTTGYPTKSDTATQDQQTKYAEVATQATDNPNAAITNRSIPPAFGTKLPGNPKNPRKSSGTYLQLAQKLAGLIASTNNLDLNKGVPAKDLIDILQSLKN